MLEGLLSFYCKGILICFPQV